MKSSAFKMGLSDLIEVSASWQQIVVKIRILTSDRSKNIYKERTTSLANFCLLFSEKNKQYFPACIKAG